MEGSDGEGHREGEWEQREGLGLSDGEREGGEQSLASGEPGRGGEGGGGSVMKSAGIRASL